jgi:hypothetical protein
LSISVLQAKKFIGADEAVAKLETSRFYFFGVLSLTGIALLGFIATAIVTRRRVNP